MSKRPISRSDLLERAFGSGGVESRPRDEAFSVVPSAEPTGGADEPDTLTYDLRAGETAYLRRSSLLTAHGRFAMDTTRIAAKRLPVMGLFSGQNLWANRFTAQGDVRLVAGRDYHGVVVGLAVTPDQPVWLQPALYLGHRGTLDFVVKQVATRAFWTLTRATGTGTVQLKVPGRAFSAPLSDRDLIVDTTYVAAIRGTFAAHGKVFGAGQYLKSGEAENVRLTGSGEVSMQTEVPADAGGSGGFLGGIIDLFA